MQGRLIEDALRMISDRIQTLVDQVPIRIAHYHREKPHDIEVVTVPEIKDLNRLLKVGSHRRRIYEKRGVFALKRLSRRQHVIQSLLIIGPSPDILEGLLANAIK